MLEYCVPTFELISLLGTPHASGCWISIAQVAAFDGRSLSWEANILKDKRSRLHLIELQRYIFEVVLATGVSGHRCLSNLLVVWLNLAVHLPWVQRHSLVPVLLISEFFGNMQQLKQMDK